MYIYMEQYEKEFLNELRAERKSYADMVDFCCDDMILNNSLISELAVAGYYFDTYCGTAWSDVPSNWKNPEKD